MTPGACASAPHRSDEVGTPTSFAVSSTLPTAVDLTSTTGDSAVTVTFSVSVATCNCASTVNVWPMLRTMFGRVKVWKPESSNFSA